MADKIFFKIGDTDLTAFCNIQEHKVNSVDITQTWTDGNWEEHETFMRTRVEGTVILGFQRAADEADFMVLMKNQRQSAGWYPVTVYVQNTGETMEIKAFLKTEAESKWNLVNNAQWKTVTVTIYER